MAPMALGALLLTTAACGGNGDRGPSLDASGSQSTTSSSPAPSAPVTTGVKAGNLFKVSLASDRGYKYGVTISSFRVVVQPADPGFIRLSYSAQVTIANETPDRKTPDLKEVSVKLSYDSRTASELETSSKLTAERTPVVPFNCTSQYQANKPYCEALFNFEDPQPVNIDIGRSVTVRSVAYAYGWTAREADASKVLAFLEHPALVVAQLKEDLAYIRNAPMAPPGS